MALHAPMSTRPATIALWRLGALLRRRDKADAACAVSAHAELVGDPAASHHLSWSRRTQGSRWTAARRGAAASAGPGTPVPVEVNHVDGEGQEEEEE